MSATDYTVGYGSSISFATITAGSPGSYTKVAQTKDISGPNAEVGKVNVTNNDSPSNTKEYGPGMIDPQEAEYELVYKAAGQAALLAIFGDGNIYSWKEQYPDGSYWIFPGFISKFGNESKTEDEAITAKVSIQLTGKPVFTPHS